jgi:hypothetical protein
MRWRDEVQRQAWAREARPVVNAGPRRRLVRRTVNGEAAHQRVRVGVASRTAVGDAFKFTRGTVSGARRRTRDMQETPRKGSGHQRALLDVHG